MGLLVIPGCSDSRSTAAIPKAEHVGLIEAHITARRSGYPQPVSHCLVGDRGDPSGSLKVRNGDAVHVYPDSEIVEDMSESEVVIRLKADYSVEIQVNGNTDCVLHLEIRQGGKIIYSDEAGPFGLIAASN